MTVYVHVLDESVGWLPYNLPTSGSRRYSLSGDSVSCVGFAPMEDAYACFRKADEPGCRKALQRLPGRAIEYLRLQS